MKQPTKEAFDDILNNYSKWASEAVQPTEEDLTGFTNMIIDNLKHAVKEQMPITVQLKGKDSGRTTDAYFSSTTGDCCYFKVFGNSYNVPFEEINDLPKVKVQYEQDIKIKDPRWAYVYIVESEAQGLAQEILDYIESDEKK